jgi:peptide-methionine (S)-S-oxide reductase
MENKKTEVAVFGGGCFWCTEAVFKMLRGVHRVEPGYAGGHTENPTYYEVMRGDTGHAEVIRVVYDPAVITYRTLLTVFFGSHDATELNRQGNDVGTEYRSVVLYSTPTQKELAEAFIQELNTSSTEGDPIVTEVAPLTTFYQAEQEHLDYYAKNKSQGYCQIIIAPKLKKVQKEFATLLQAPH